MPETRGTPSAIDRLRQAADAYAQNRLPFTSLPDLRDRPQTATEAEVHSEHLTTPRAYDLMRDYMNRYWNEGDGRMPTEVRSNRNTGSNVDRMFDEFLDWFVEPFDGDKYELVWSRVWHAQNASDYGQKLLLIRNRLSSEYDRWGGVLNQWSHAWQRFTNSVRNRYEVDMRTPESSPNEPDNVFVEDDLRPIYDPRWVNPNDRGGVQPTGEDLSDARVVNANFSQVAPNLIRWEPVSVEADEPEQTPDEEPVRIAINSDIHQYSAPEMEELFGGGHISGRHREDISHDNLDDASFSYRRMETASHQYFVNGHMITSHPQLFVDRFEISGHEHDAPEDDEHAHLRRVNEQHIQAIEMSLQHGAPHLGIGHASLAGRNHVAEAVGVEPNALYPLILVQDPTTLTRTENPFSLAREYLMSTRIAVEWRLRPTTDNHGREIPF